MSRFLNGLTPPMPAGLEAKHRAVGYVPRAPGCGDCAHGMPLVHHVRCDRHGMAVQPEGRCPLWQADPVWLRANPGIAPVYSGLSAVEVALLEPGAVPAPEARPC